MKNTKAILKISSFLAVVVGVILVCGAVWGISFTYTNIARENIITSDDASIPGVPVRGPFTLKSQADIIRVHTLNLTNGMTYAEMSREDPSRSTWITATTLTTALNLAIVTYAFSCFIFLFGLISIWTGITFYALSKRY